MPNPLNVEILLFARAAEVADAKQIHIELEGGSTIRDLRDKLESSFPDLQPIMAVSRWAVDNEFVEDATKLDGTESVAMIPPVSGG